MLTSNDTKQVIQKTIDFVLQTETLLWEIISSKYFNLQKDKECNPSIVKVDLIDNIGEQLQKRFEILQRSNSEKKTGEKDWEFFTLQLADGIIRDIIGQKEYKTSFKQIGLVVSEKNSALKSLVTKINKKYREISKLHNDICSLRTNNNKLKEEKENEKKSWSQVAGNTKQTIHEHFQGKINKLNDGINEIENSISIQERQLYEMKAQLSVLEKEHQQLRSLINHQWKNHVEERYRFLIDEKKKELNVIDELEKERGMHNLNNICISKILDLTNSYTDTISAERK